MISKEQAVAALSEFPDSDEIERFDYYMAYVPESNKWVAAYEGGRSAVWYEWKNQRFELLSFSEPILNQDMICHETVLEISNN